MVVEVLTMKAQGERHLRKLLQRGGSHGERQGWKNVIVHDRTCPIITIVKVAEQENQMFGKRIEVLHSSNLIVWTSN